MKAAPTAIQFYPNGWKGYAHSSGGTVPASGALLTVQASAQLGEIDLTALISGISCAIRFGAADARIIAAELLAAAAAIDGTCSEREVCRG
ncbi:MAG: hypothetical protein DI587_36330 [Variovorax paradoxus]|nr:MAG: hypothetical protein DI583_36330 [Variovorax paradoxus]PZQ00774.1 MAG: hypothetical protein DI587_36330 [Variovorax paradoxus]